MRMRRPGLPCRRSTSPVTHGKGRSMGDKDEVTVHKSALEAIGKVLHEDAYSYDGDGSPADLASRGNITVAQLGNYPAGQGYAKSIANAQSSVGGQAYNNFITAYKQ